jgi:hypothetical protein
LGVPWIFLERNKKGYKKRKGGKSGQKEVSSGDGAGQVGRI